MGHGQCKRPRFEGGYNCRFTAGYVLPRNRRADVYGNSVLRRAIGSAYDAGAWACRHKRDEVAGTDSRLVAHQGDRADVDYPAIRAGQVERNKAIPARAGCHEWGEGAIIDDSIRARARGFVPNATVTRYLTGCWIHGQKD